jgi:predicted small secreted protein
MRRIPIMLCALSLVLAGCDPTEGGAVEGVTVLAKAEGWRSDLQQSAGFSYVLVEVAADADTAARAWAENVPSALPDRAGDPAEPGIYRSLETVDFSSQVVVVYSSGESGTCPAWVTDLTVVEGKLVVTLESTAEPGGACTDDFRSYRLVLAVDRDRLPALSELPIDRIDVPSENLVGVDGRVVLYPFIGD